jgi:hypothetical protein
MERAEIIAIAPRRQSYASAFSSALLDPEIAKPVSIVGPAGKAADKRYNVYRNNVTVSLIEALISIFPATARITGPDFFRAMARFHIRETPPTSPLLFEYGRDFPDFVARYEYAQSVPWLADVARLERAWLDAYHAADSRVISGEELSAVAPEQLGGLRFRVHPATRIVRSAFPVVAILVANKSPDPVGRIEEVVAQDALVTRPDTDVALRLLQPGGAEFLTRLIDGETLEVAVAGAIDIHPTFDLPGMIGEMIAAGVFTDILTENDNG